MTRACTSADRSGCNQSTSDAAVNSECGLVWLFYLSTQQVNNWVIQPLLLSLRPNCLTLLSINFLSGQMYLLVCPVCFSLFLLFLSLSCVNVLFFLCFCTVFYYFHHFLLVPSSVCHLRYEMYDINKCAAKFILLTPWCHVSTGKFDYFHMLSSHFKTSLNVWGIDW